MADVATTDRWRGVVAVALVAGTVGLVARRPGILLLAVVGVAYAAYPRLTSAPELQLDLDRRLDGYRRTPGDDVAIEVTLTNAGSGHLPDLRVVDGVPPALEVVGGTARHGTALRPGESATFSYVVEARHGRHRFEPASVVAADLSGAHERRTTVSDDTELACVTPEDEAPTARRTNAAAGRIVGATGGTGVEFDHSRAYRSGDPLGRIDWRRYARRWELTTVLFREARATTVVVAVDARRQAARGLADGPDAISSADAAADRLATALVGARNQVGLAALGWPDAWLAPATGRDHLLRLRERLGVHRAFVPAPPEDQPTDARLDDLRARLPDDAQVVVVSPLCDDAVADAIRTLVAEGHPVTVVSPDVTSRDSTGRQLAAVERASRVGALRRADVTVVEWDPTEPLAVALETAREAAWA